MGIFDAFTGAPAKKAAAANRQLYNQNFDRGLGFFDTGKQEGLGYLQTGMDTARGDLGGAIGAFEPLAALGSKYGGATDMLLNAQGVNGQAGIDKARGAFQAGPGYQWALEQGMEGLERTQAGRSFSGSGNTMQEAIKYGQGLANQQYDKWLGNFNQFVNPELQATQGASQGVAQGFTNMGTVAQQGNTNMASLTASDAANRVNLGNTTTSGLANTNNAEAQAKMAASGNLWNFGLNALSTLAGLPSGGSMFSGKNASA